MFKSKKVTWSLVGLLAIFVGSSPFIGMFYTKKVFEKAIALVAEHENLKIEVVAYESGIRHSQAKTVITFDEHNKSGYKAMLAKSDGEPGAASSQITLIHTITQGPFGQGWTDHGLSLAHIDTKIEEGEGLASIPVEISSWVGFNTNITSKVKMENWAYQSLVNGTGIKAVDIDIELVINPFSDNFNYRIDIPTITYNDPVYDIELKGLKITSTQKIKKDIEFDNNHYQFDDFNLRLKNTGQPEGQVSNAATDQSLSLSGIKLAFVSKPNGELTDWDLDGQFEKIISTGAVYGPGEYKIHLGSLDSKVLAKIRHTFKDQNLEPSAKQMQSVNFVRQLLMAKPNLTIEKFNYQTESGVVDVMGKAQFKPDTVIDEKHPAGAIQGVLAELKAKMPTKMVEKWVRNYVIDMALMKHFSTVQEEPKIEVIEAKRKEIVAQMEQQLPKSMEILKSKNILVAEKEESLFKINVENGQLSINDQPKTTVELQEVLKSLQL